MAGNDRPLVGGSPLAVLGRLFWYRFWSASFCLRSGSILSNIVAQHPAPDPHIWDMGFDAFRWLWRYFLLGAVIVIPIWI